jgi:hypothetical protein
MMMILQNLVEVVNDDDNVKRSRVDKKEVSEENK